MPRTKDFLLILVTIAFLGLVISSTVLGDKQANVATVQLESDEMFVDTEISTTQAEAIVPGQIDRQSRLAQMRQKIANSGELIMPAPVEVIENTLSEEGSQSSTAEEVAEAQLCQNHSPFAGQWPVSNIDYQEADGTRNYYRIISRPDYTSTTSETELTEEVTLLQLPINPLPSPSSNCISSNVVGIASDYSLIGNNELPLYSVFGESTRIGVALDGYPIYGLTDRELDQCGGSSHSGSYAYYLSAERDTVLNCFTAEPAVFQ